MQPKHEMQGPREKREIDYLIATELGCNRKDVETIFQAMHPGTKRPYRKKRRNT